MSMVERSDSGLSSPEAKLGLKVEDLWDVQEPQLTPSEKLNSCFESIHVSAFPPAPSSQGRSFFLSLSLYLLLSFFFSFSFLILRFLGFFLFFLVGRVWKWNYFDTWFLLFVFFFVRGCDVRLVFCNERGLWIFNLRTITSELEFGSRLDLIDTHPVW